MNTAEILTDLIAVLEREQALGKTHVYLSPENWDYLNSAGKSPETKKPITPSHKPAMRLTPAPVPAPVAPPIVEPEKAELPELPAKPPTLGLSLESTTNAGPRESRQPTIVPLPQPPFAFTLEDVRHTVSECQKCSLGRSRTQTVFGVGSLHPEVMFVGDTPSREDDRNGSPFSEKIGELLQKIVAAMQLGMHQVYLTNIVKCMPPSRRPPDPEEAWQCLPYLAQQIALVKPKIIVLLGPAALRYLLGMENFEQARGQWRDFHGIPCLPTYHPAYLLRVPEAKRAVWTDMKEVMAKLETLNKQK